MENADLLKEYFLSYGKCVYCSQRFNDSDASSHETDSVVKHCKHHHELSSFFVEEHMIPVIMQQFLIDLGTQAAPKVVAKRSDDALEERSIDIKEIEKFWQKYLKAIPSDLELIWDTIDNGLTRYLQVILWDLAHQCDFIGLKRLYFYFNRF